MPFFKAFAMFTLFWMRLYFRLFQRTKTPPRRHHLKFLDKHWQQMFGKLQTRYFTHPEELLTKHFRPVRASPFLERGTLLVFSPFRETIEVHQRALTDDCRMALMMAYAHIVTHLQKGSWEEIPTLVIYFHDVTNAEGPASNELWQTYQIALSLLTPKDNFIRVCKLFDYPLDKLAMTVPEDAWRFTEPQHEREGRLAVMGIFGISQTAFHQRVYQLSTGTGGFSTIDALSSICQREKSS